MSEWIVKTIGEICDLGNGKVQTGPFGSQLHQSDYQAEGYPFVMPKDIINGKIDESSVARVSISHVDRLSKHKLLLGDIIYGRRGDIGRQALVIKENVGWLCGSGCLRISLGKFPIDPMFLHLYLKLPEVMSWVENQAVGATMPNLNTKILRSVPIRYPVTVYHQQQIAAILSAYDELIENNDRRITLLEKMAEEIYREWFVRLRFPGHEQVKFNKGIPEGWEVKPFAEVTLINPTERLDKNQDKPFVGMENLSLTSMLFSHEEFRNGNAGSKFRNNDVLFPRITPSLENGKRGYVMNLEDNQVALGSTEFIVMREKIISSEYIYFLTCSSEFRTNAEQSMIGASGRQRVHEGCFNCFLVKTPPQILMRKFSTIIKPSFAKIKQLYDSNKILKQTRDRLLTRLISGKLSVEDLDIQFPPSMIEETTRTK